MTSAVASGPSTFVVHGEVGRMFEWLAGTRKPPKEAICDGVAGCGKTHAFAVWAVNACNDWHESKGLILRETRVSLNDSVLPILEEKVLGMDHPAVLNGPSREHRTKYSHPRLGGEIILGGMDNPTKLFSTEYDWIWFNECQETTKAKWESLHRALRRAKMPFSILLGDCNPEDEFHWAIQRMTAGANGEPAKCERMIGRFWDNPTFFNHETQEWTAHGLDYLQRLRENLTGVRYMRLYKGLWVSASGQVWENYDRAVHLIDGEVEEVGGRYFLHVEGWNGAPGRAPDEDGECEPIELQWFVGGQDVGHTAPGNAGVLGIDSEGRAYQVAEVHYTKQDHEWWGDVWAELYEEYPVKAIICDHDKALIQHLNRRIRQRGPDGMPGLAREANKTRGKGDEMAGIDEVRVRFKRREDGTRGLYILRNSLRRGRDPELVRDGKPTCLHEEIPAYVYPPTEDGKPIKDSPDPGCSDHGCDRLRYQMRWIKDRSFKRTNRKPYFPRGSVNDQLGLNDFFYEHGFTRPA